MTGSKARNLANLLSDGAVGTNEIADSAITTAKIAEGAVPEAPPVLKPEPVSPADNATDIGETPTLDGGTYYSLYGKTHAISRFQVASDVGFTTIVYDSGEISGTETHGVPSGNLLESTNYYWRVYYEDEDGVESEFSDTFEFTTSNNIQIDLEDPNNIGEPTNGGFLVGIIDTVAGTIDSQDDYQTGERYALIVAPKEYENGRNTTPASGLTKIEPLRWDAQDRGAESGSITRWDGLSSTNNILAKNDSDYEVFEHIRQLRSTYPPPSDGGSDWYVPAMDELELFYRNLKPTSADNTTLSEADNFPGTQEQGFNPSSDPTGSVYTVSDPSQTSVEDFKIGGAQAPKGEIIFWTSTDADSSNAWEQAITYSGIEGRQNTYGKSSTTNSRSVRPVRRIPV